MGDKYQQMQDEMSRFEAEISGAEVMAHHIVSTGTYNSVRQRLDGMPFEHGLVPPPLIFPGIPPPPPPPSLMVPPQVHQRLRCQLEAPPLYLPPGMPGPQLPPPRPQPAVLSAAPKLYKQTKEVVEEPTVVVIPEIIPEVKKRPPSPPRPAPPPPEPPRPRKEKKNRKVVRTAGGQVWEDVSLLEWPDDDFRMFCGDLGNDVTDELLIRTFSKYSSFQRAKVIRDKRTNKSKGFGFVSFKEPADFIKAMKDMDGRYVGSRPIKLRKSSWRARSLDVVRRKERERAALRDQLLTGGRS